MLALRSDLAHVVVLVVNVVNVVEGAHGDLSVPKSSGSLICVSGGGVRESYMVGAQHLVSS